MHFKISEELIQITQKSYCSRSAILTHFTCPYKYFLSYELDGVGYHSEKQSLDLLNGSVCHRGLQHLFEHCRLEHPDGDFQTSCVGDSVIVANELWQKELGKRGIWLKNDDEYNRLDWILAEQECMWEGLIRSFAVNNLKDFLEEYEILEVEKEEVFDAFSLIVTFLGKADATLRRKRDNKVIVLSIKTASEYAEVTEKNNLHDMQGCSETFLVQERYRRWYEMLKSNLETNSDATFENIYHIMMTRNLYNYLMDCVAKQTPPTVFAVQYLYLIKGKRREDPNNSGIYKQQNFLCHPLKLDSIQSIQIGRGGGIRVIPAEYKWKWSAGKFAKGWDKTDIWNDIGISKWIEMLATGQIQPEEGNPFDRVIKIPDLICRSEQEIQEWLVSTRFKAEVIYEQIEILKSYVDEPETLQKLLWQFFPKNTQSCHNYYGHDCQFVRHCHEMESIEDLQTAGEIITRVPHHELEKENAIKEGWLEEDE